MIDLAEYAGKRIVVTGGAGFIGSHLVDRLLHLGAEKVAVVDNLFLGKPENLALATQSSDRFRFYREDAAERDAIDAVLDEEKPDLVFNLATKALIYSFFNPAGAFRVNTDIALNLCEALRHRRYARLVHVSTSEVYGTAQFVPMTEDHPLLAETTYAAGKAAADLATASYINQYDIDVCTVRPFNNYGPRQNDGELAAIIPLTARRIMSGQKPVIQGDGLQTRDFVYVHDTVEGLLRFGLADAAKGGVYNLASGRETSVKKIIKVISDYFCYAGEIAFEPSRVADVRRHMADMDKAKAVIGDVAMTTLEEGMKPTLDWYRARNE